MRAFGVRLVTVALLVVVAATPGGPGQAPSMTAGPIARKVRPIPKQVCAKRPRELQRLLRKHSGETGVVVHGWFPRARIYGPVEWMHVPVNVHGGAHALLSQIGKRTVWLPTQPGRLLIRAGMSVYGDQMSPDTHEASVDLRPGEVALFVFATPRPSLSGRFDKPVWCGPILVRQLGPT